MLTLLRPSHLLLWVMLLSHTNGKVEAFCGYDRDARRGDVFGMDVKMGLGGLSGKRYLLTWNENTKPSITVNLWTVFGFTGRDIATFDMDLPFCVNQWCELKATLKTDSNATEVFVEVGDYVAGCRVSRKAIGDAVWVYVEMSDYSYEWWWRDTRPQHCPVTEVKEGPLMNLLVPDCHNYTGARLYPLPQTATTAGNTTTTTSSPTTYSLLTVISAVVITIVVVEMVTASVLVVTTVRIVLKKK